MSEEFDEILGLITAHDLILRTLFAQMAKNETQPRKAANEAIELLLAQLRARRGDAPADEARTFEAAVEALKEFQRHVDLRLQV